jgi:transposase InsO family protein
MGVRPSMGTVGDAYDNAMAESFFATLECELIDRRSWPTKVCVRPTHLDDGLCDQVIVLEDDQRCGSNSAIRLAGCEGKRSSTSRRYA